MEAFLADRIALTRKKGYRHLLSVTKYAMVFIHTGNPFATKYLRISANRIGVERQLTFEEIAEFQTLAKELIALHNKSLNTQPSKGSVVEQNALS